LLDRIFASPGRFPGWRVVWAGLVLLTMSSGVGFYGIAVYLGAFSREFGWTVSSMSLATTVFFAVAGVAGLGVAKANDRFDLRWTVLGGSVLAALALVLMGAVRERWHLFAVYVLFSVGWSAAGLGPVTTVVTRWFHVRRGAALALASTGLSLGGMVLTGPMKWLIDTYGIASGSRWLAVAWLAGTVPVTVLFIRPHPQPCGWQPDGEPQSAGEHVPPSGTPLAEAVRSRFFVATSAAYLVAMAPQVGALQQMVKLAEERAGRTAATAVTVVLSSAAVIGRFVGGWLSRRVGVLRAAMSVVVVQVVTLSWLAFAGVTPNLLAAAFAFGLTVGNLLMMQSLLLAERFGVRDFPRISARQGLFVFAGTASGPFLLGWMHDAAGGYRAAYLAAATCSAVAVALFAAATGDARPPSASAASES
jgi:MFS family permease